MKTSDNGLKFIAKHESFRSKPYLDPVGVPTIGYGNTYYPNNVKVRLSDAAISEAEGLELLQNIVKRFEEGVNRLVKRAINQNQFDALVSFSYNLGLGNLQSSTLLKKINANPCDESIAYEFSRWNKAGGKVLNGLVKRRKEEAELYFK